MKILAVGFNHKTTSIELREKFYLSVIEQELLLAEYKNDPAVIGAVILSTCNRCEIYATVVDNHSTKDFMKKLFEVKNQPFNVMSLDMFYCHENAAAVNHFLSVACGLDSLILGEKQILGQIKEAVNLSRQKAMLDKTLNILTNLVIETGKKARTETQIDFGGMSVSAAAVSMAQMHLGTLKDKKVLVVGSGKMGRLALNHLSQKNTKEIFLMNRTIENASTIAQEFNATIAPFWDLKEILTEVDVCICSAGAPHYLITKDLLNSVMALRKKELLLVDISIPRNIDPRVSEVNNVHLISLDQLDSVIESNLLKRQSAVEEVTTLIERKKNEFYQSMNKIELLHNKQLLINK